jgi:katanin p60 ATPase-containing subunit A1
LFTIGTGKTLLAKAVCSFNSSMFFSCSSSSLISKYRGESEKIVRCLFEAARLCAPSIIFLDEVDALVSARGDNEHEASRRLKTEFFSQMDGLSSSKSATDDDVSKSVMVLATTNCPWDLDDAMRRRLEKRIYIPLPDYDARVQLFHICLKKIPVSDDVSADLLAEITEGFSGSDVLICCRDASMMPMRRLLTMLSPAQLAQMRSEGSLVIPKVLMADFRGAIGNTKPSVAQDTCARYETWNEEFSNN